MARPLRIEQAGGRYHATARGNERKHIFREDADRFHFLELLSEMPERFGVRLHAYVLMDNHFHLLIETPEPNLSRAMQWLGVSYSVWFNRRHRRVGHLFQGRFKACIVQDDAGWQELARYVHLNPVRVGRLGLSKPEQAASRRGFVGEPAPEVIAERLRVLRDFRWSSYRGYAGYSAPLAWICTQPLDRLCGGRNEPERRSALRDYTEQSVRQGCVERPWDRLVGGVVLGTESFAQTLREGLQSQINEREQPQARELTPPAKWHQIIAALERAREEPWESFRSRHNDWGRDAALWLGRRQGRLRLAELGDLVGGLDYSAVSVAVRRFGERLEKDASVRTAMERIERDLLNVEI